MDKLISVMIPVYNAENNISKCLESLLAQTYSNIQIVLVNDGSKDSSLEICNKYANQDSRIKLINQENGGEGAARNRGLAESQGELICFVDADDYVKSDFIKNLYDLQLEHNAELSICGFTELRGEQVLNQTGGITQIMSQEQAMENLLKEDSFKGYVWNKMFHMDIIRENHIQFDSTLAVWTDVLFVFTYMHYVKKVVFFPEPMYFYIYVEDSVSHQQNHILGIKKAYSAIRAKNQIIDYIPQNYDNVKRQLNIRYVQSALAVIRNIGYENGDKNSEYYKDSIEIIKKSENKYILKYLSKKDRLFVFICKYCPSVLMLLYKIKKDTGK